MVSSSFALRRRRVGLSAIATSSLLALVVMTIMTASCTKFSATDDGVDASTTPSSDDGSVAAEANTGIDADEPDPKCPLSSLYCEHFTTRRNIEDLLATGVAIGNESVEHALIGTVGARSRALRITGNAGPGGASTTNGQLTFLLGTPPPSKFRLHARITVIEPGNFDLLSLAFRAGADEYLFMSIQDGNFVIAQYNGAKTVLASTNTSVKADTTYEVDLDYQSGGNYIVTINGGAPVSFSSLVAKGATSFGIEYGPYSNVFHTKGVFVFDEVELTER